MDKRKFFIDTDTASDDAVALLMALEWKDVDVLGISIVSGNMPIEQGSINARYTVELCKKNTPVYIGADKPLKKNYRHWAKNLFDQKLEEEPWFGLEQEYFIIDPKTSKPFSLII